MLKSRWNNSIWTKKYVNTVQGSLSTFFGVEDNVRCSKVAEKISSWPANIRETLPTINTRNIKILKAISFLSP
jgi:hypothetical protein